MKLKRTLNSFQNTSSDAATNSSPYNSSMAEAVQHPLADARGIGERGQRQHEQERQDRRPGRPERGVVHQVQRAQADRAGQHQRQLRTATSAAARDTAPGSRRHQPQEQHQRPRHVDVGDQVVTQPHAERVQQVQRRVRHLAAGHHQQHHAGGERDRQVGDRQPQQRAETLTQGRGRGECARHGQLQQEVIGRPRRAEVIRALYRGSAWRRLSFQRGDGCDPRRLHRLADRRAGQATRDEVGGIDRRRGGACRAQVIRLRISVVLVAAAGRACRPRRRPGKASSRAGRRKRIQRAQQFQHGGRFQLERAVRVQMLAADQFGQRGVFGRHLQSLRPAPATAPRRDARARCGAAARRTASAPCRGRGSARRSRPRRCPARAARPRPAPAPRARRCRSPDGTPRAAARRTARRLRETARPTRRTRAARAGTPTAAARPAPCAFPPTRVPAPGDRPRRRAPSAASAPWFPRPRVKPSGAKRAAKRATRNTRTGSSTNAGDTWRSTRASMSRTPPNGSVSVPCSSSAIALMVRSRRARSCSSVTVGIGLEHEAVIAAPALALGARQRVFLARVGMQEHRKVLAHRLVAQRQQLLRQRADHHVVAVDHRAVQQFVADRAADQIDLHGGILPCAAEP